MLRAVDPEVISWQRHLISKSFSLYSAPNWEKCMLTKGEAAKETSAVQETIHT